MFSLGGSWTRRFLSAALAAGAAPASAQLERLPDCGDLGVLPSAAFATWTNPRRDAETLIVNEPAEVVLRELDGPNRRRTHAYGADIPFTIAREGRYEIALGNRASVEVFQAGDVVRAEGRRGGPACADVQSIHSYRLDRGDHMLRVRGRNTRLLVIIYQ